MDLKSLFKLEKIREKTNEKKGKANVANLLILVLIGVLLAMLSNTFKDTSTSNINNNNLPKGKGSVTQQKSQGEDEKNSEAKDEEAEVEKKLKDTLENIQGVGNVKVMVYFKGGEEQIPAININDATSLTEEKDVDGGTRKITQKNDGRTIVMMQTDNGTKPFVVKKYKPQVTGICIVAEGAEDRLIKLQIQKAVLNLFDLKESQVNVYPMKK